MHLLPTTLLKPIELWVLKVSFVKINFGNFSFDLPPLAFIQLSNAATTYAQVSSFAVAGGDGDRYFCFFLSTPQQQFFPIYSIAHTPQHTPSPFSSSSFHLILHFPHSVFSIFSLPTHKGTITPHTHSLARSLSLFLFLYFYPFYPHHSHSFCLFPSLAAVGLPNRLHIHRKEAQLLQVLSSQSFNKD